MQTSTDLTGRTFGKLVVLGKAGYQRRTTVWTCACGCGKEVNVRRDRLVGDFRISCGCLSGRLIQGDTVAANPAQHSLSRISVLPKRYEPKAILERLLVSVFKIYRGSAGRRGHEFALTQEQLSIIVQQPCHYCGGTDQRALAASGQPSFASFKRRYPGLENLPTEFPLNGIDRKNSKVGYVLENCVPCCKACNIGKQTQGYEQFIARCCAIARRHCGTPISIHGSISAANLAEPRTGTS